MKSTAKIKHNIQGILLLDKPSGISSNGALQRVKHLFCAKKAGHTGSLDPLATGMLPICFGEATKFSQFLLDSDKSYRVVMQLGVKTTTGDAEGEIIETQSVGEISEQQIKTVFNEFHGAIEQIPPMYSALKHQGRPLYELARKGIEIQRNPRVVQIYNLHLIKQENNYIYFDVHCSKGTYVRSLVEDMAERLNTVAHVSLLRRLAVTPYENTKMYTINELEEVFQKTDVFALHKLLLPVETSVQALPAVNLSTSAAFYLRMGQPVLAPNLPTQGFVRVFGDDGFFMGIGEIMEDGRVSPRRLVAAAA